MNRLTAVTTAYEFAGSSATCAEHPLLRQRKSGALSQCVLAPLHYEPKYAYPLLVWLHGEGGDEQELKRVMPLVSMRNYVSVAVRGPEEAPRGYDWPQTAVAIQTAELRIMEAVRQAQQRFNVNSERVFVAGYGTGGTMAVRVALRHPDRFSGAVSLGGPFPAGHAPLARLAQARKMRLLIAHCRDSAQYSVDDLCRELSLFHAAGMCITLRQYPCGDELTTQMLSDANAWLMEQVTGVPAEEQEPAALPSDWN